MPARSDSETLRKWLHLAPGALAFAVRDLGAGGSLALLGALLAFNLWCFPRLGAGRLWRSRERERGSAPGIVLYPVALLLLWVASRGRLEVLAGGWGMLAFGDAAATLAGRRWGRRPLPWNESKTWLGAVAFALASWLSVVVLVAWTSPGRYSPLPLLAAAAGAAALGAVLESLPWALDDNVGVTLLGGGALYLALELSGGVTAVPGAAVVAGAMLAAAGLALAARLGGALDSPAALAGLGVAAAVALGTGWRGLAPLGLFVVAGTWASRRRRRLSGEAHPRSPRRPRHVLANGAVAAACGLLAACRPGEAVVAALVAALAVAMADTVGGEIGLAGGGRTWRITDGHSVPPGTDGGVSRLGLAATAVSAAALAAVAVAVGLLDWEAGLVVATAGLCGALLDSLLGATLERRALLDNESVNLLSTLAGAWGTAQAVELWLTG